MSNPQYVLEILSFVPPPPPPPPPPQEKLLLLHQFFTHCDKKKWQRTISCHVLILNLPTQKQSNVNIWHNTQRAWVVGYAAHARLAVYRIGLAWQNWKWSWVCAVRRRRPTESTWVRCAPEATQDGCAPEGTWEAFYNLWPMLCWWDRIARNVTASSERECEHPQFIEHEKVYIYHRVISRERREGKQTVQTSKPEEDAAKAEWGQACSIRHKMATDLAVRAQEIRWMVWLEWSCLAVNMC